MDIGRCFEILGLDPSASPEEVKQAYRDLVDVWHPDRFLHNHRLKQKVEEKLKELNISYETVLGSSRNSSELIKSLDTGRRKYPRKSCTIPVDGFSMDNSYRSFNGNIQNISAGGLFIEISESFSIGSKVSVSFPLPSFGDLFNITCKITWKNKQGVGVKFMISQRYKKLISEFV